MESLGKVAFVSILSFCFDYAKLLMKEKEIGQREEERQTAEKVNIMRFHSCSTWKSTVNM